MKEFFRRLKLGYAIYNIFHKKKLVHNQLIYKKLGLNKRYFSPISSKDFKSLPNNSSTNEIVNNQQLTSTSLFQTLSEENKNSLLQFNENGFSVIQNYLSVEKVDKINNEIEMLLKQGTIHLTKHNRIMFAIHSSPLLKNIGDDEKLKKLLSTLLNGNAVLFQSINFLMGSEQATHSDSIHMTTYPLGGLLGVWIALEDITEENGPLHYYPGSHKLPYYLNSDYNNEGNFFCIGNKSYSKYEKMMQQKISELNLSKKKFLAQKGDLLIWHANLFHGGEKHIDKTKTRKSMVFHYFKEDAICYHEITQRPALIKHSTSKQ
jgi:hypothetical protein